MPPPLRLPALLALCIALLLSTVRGDVLLSEIMYHPVENPAFDANGDPVFDLTDDVHEYIEIKNTGASSVSLAGWRIAGGVDYTFPAGATISAGQHLVVAKNPARIVSVYGLNAAVVFGPWTGKLKNGGDTMRIEDAGNSVVDGVSYSATSPWAISADALGADDEWTSIYLHKSEYFPAGVLARKLTLVHSKGAASLL
jgi:hypothetical protein